MGTVVITLFNHMIVPHLYSTLDMGLHFIIFLRRNLENRMPVQVMNSAGTNSKNIVYNDM